MTITYMLLISEKQCIYFPIWILVFSSYAQACSQGSNIQYREANFLSPYVSKYVLCSASTFD